MKSHIPFQCCHRTDIAQINRVDAMKTGRNYKKIYVQELLYCDSVL